jgi:hypothetical protein
MRSLNSGAVLLQCMSPVLAQSVEGQGVEFTSVFGGAAEVHGRTASAAFDANDPTRTFWTNFAAMQNAILSLVVCPHVPFEPKSKLLLTATQGHTTTAVA